MPDKIEVLCTNGVKSAMLELVPAFERASGHTCAIAYTSTAVILEQMKGGAVADLVIGSAEAIDELARLGKVAPGSRVDLARSGIGIAVRKGAPKPDISTASAFKTALLAAKSVCMSRQGLSGIYFPTVLQRLGIAEEMKNRIVYPQSGPVGATVAAGEAELGVQQISELMPVEGIDIVGEIPAELQKVTTFSAGLGTGAKPAAKALVAHITAASTHPLYRQKGLDPA